MSTIFVPPRTTADPQTGACKTCACPTCAGLECLCRPRFFAGQLLTDETLNSLDHYIVEKNRLHNRYLHGWGVVCGLEVVCNPCNAVTVRAGYALSPCGDDIIVCKDAAVDVCALISQCADKRREWECEPFSSGPDLDCKDVEGDWILTVRYDEKSLRGITALKGGAAPSCGSGCSCGGSSGCGCGCHGHNGNGSSRQSATAATTAAQAYRSTPTTVAAQCEPTLTCEGFVFEVCKPLPKKDEQLSRGALIDHYEACIANFLKSLPEEPTGQNVTIAALYQWCCALKQKFRDDLFDHPVYNCRLADALNFACPDPTRFSTADDYKKELDTVLKTVIAVVAAEYLQYCICSSFLPPCPEMVCDPRVPLATVTMRKDQSGSCQIVRVCNLGQRRFLITFPNLGYWFSFILAPFLRWWRKLLETVCCRPFSFSQRLFAANVGGAESTNVTAGNNVMAASSDTDNRGFRAFAGRVWENRTRTVDEQTLFLGAIGATDEKGMPYLSQTELANPFFTMMTNRIAGPLLARLPDNALDTVKRGGSIFTSGFSGGTKLKSAAKAAASRDVKDLKKQVDELQSRIDELQKQLKKKK
jgi:hypothetical protein